MDLIIVSIIILAAAALTAHRVYKKYTAARSGIAPCGCACQGKSGGCASCAACVQITNQSAKTVQDEKTDINGKE